MQSPLFSCNNGLLAKGKKKKSPSALNTSFEVITNQETLET